MKFFLIPLSLSSLFYASHAFAVQSRCDKAAGDWLPFCNLPDAPGTRCVMSPDNNLPKFICTPETQGCAELGGCFGDVPPGSWYPIGLDNKSYKCRCGCFGASETFFVGPQGEISGQALIDSGRTKGFALETLDDVSNPGKTSLKSVNGLMFSKGKEQSYKFTTATGKSAILSAGHPVLIVGTDGFPKMMKKASNVTLQDELLGADGIPEKIQTIEQIAYTENLVNFNVQSKNPDHHIVSANGLLLGDSAWQERLNSHDARILLRAGIAREALELEKGTHK